MNLNTGEHKKNHGLSRVSQVKESMRASESYEINPHVLHVSVNTAEMSIAHWPKLHVSTTTALAITRGAAVIPTLLP